jgi:hypothetical protein
MAPPTSTPFSGRRSQYLDTYAKTLMAQYRVDQIRRDIQDEQSRVQYLDSLIAQARQTAAGLEAALQAQPPASLDAAVALLKAQYEGEDAQRRRVAGEGVQRARAMGLTQEDRSSITPSDRLSRDAALVNAVNLLKSPQTTPEKADALLAQARKLFPGDERRLLEAFNTPQRAQGKRAPAPGVRQLSPEEAANQEVLQQLFESTYFAGPSGIVGGYDGKAIADLRAQTPAPKGTSFATAEDAFMAAIGAVANGTLDREDFDSDADFEYAKDIYAEAKAKKAYRNDQRANFENAVLTARKEVSDLERKRAEQIGTTYDDPAQEALRRELTARGYTFAKRGAADEWKNAYVKLQKTPDYNAYITAHQRVLDARSEGKPLGPSTRAENIVTTYTMMKNRRDEPITIDDLRRQLDRVGIEGKLQDDAIAFGLAYWELGGPDQDAEMLAQQKEADDLRMKEELRREESARNTEKEAKMAREATQRLEEQQVQEVGGLRERQAQANSLYAEYKRLLAQGYTPEAARKEVQRLEELRFFIFNAKPRSYEGGADKVLMGTEFSDAREAMVDAERGKVPSPPESRIYPDSTPSPRGAPMREEEELVFGGGVLPPEEPAAAAPKAPAKPSAKPKAKAKPAPAPAPLKPVKASDALMNAMMNMAEGTPEFNRALDQYNRLIDQGN